MHHNDSSFYMHQHSLAIHFDFTCKCRMFQSYAGLRRWINWQYFIQLMVSVRNVLEISFKRCSMRKHWGYCLLDFRWDLRLGPPDFAAGINAYDWVWGCATRKQQVGLCTHRFWSMISLAFWSWVILSSATYFGSLKRLHNSFILLNALYSFLAWGL